MPKTIWYETEDLDDTPIDLNDRLSQYGITRFVFNPTEETRFILAGFDPDKKEVYFNNKKAYFNRKIAVAAILSYIRTCEYSGICQKRIIITNAFEFVFDIPITFAKKDKSQ